MSGPDRRPTTPVGNGHTCSPKIAEGAGLSSAPSLIISLAPPTSPCGTPSSAGWKMNFTVPGRSASPGQHFGGAHENGHVVVVAARVHDPDFLPVPCPLRDRLEGQVHHFGDRKRIHVGAEGDHRPRLPTAKTPTTPFRATPVCTSAERRRWSATSFAVRTSWLESSGCS